MARGRMLSKSLSTSQKRAALIDTLGPLAEFGQALYMLLIAHADDFGRGVGDVFTIRLTIDPLNRRSDDEFADTLLALHTVGLITWYEADGRQLLQIEDFEKYQTGLHKRTASAFPPPPANRQELPGNSRFTRARGTELNLREQNLREEQIPALTRGALLAPRPTKPAPLLRGPDPTCAFDGPRVRVPQRLHDEFVGRRNHADADRELWTWYAQVSDEWTSGARATDEPGGDMFAFWRARYDERWPPTPKKPATPRRPAWASTPQS